LQGRNEEYVKTGTLFGKAVELTDERFACCRTVARAAFALLVQMRSDGGQLICTGDVKEKTKKIMNASYCPPTR